MLGLLVLAAGCQTMTGRTVGQWTEDKAITGKIKTKLATREMGSVTRVRVRGETASASPSSEEPKAPVVTPPTTK